MKDPTLMSNFIASDYSTSVMGSGERLMYVICL